MISVLVFVYLFINVHSDCFFPEMQPEFPVGLSTTSIGTTESGTDHESISRLIEWKDQAQSHMTSWQNRDTDLREWMECYADSMTFDYIDLMNGERLLLSIKEWSILMNTIREFETNFSIKHCIAKYVDDHSVELQFVANMRRGIGSMSGTVMHWSTSSVHNGNMVKVIGDQIVIEIPITMQWRYNDQGLIVQHTLIAPKYTRYFYGVLWNLYITATGPIGEEMDINDSLTLYGYNIIVAVSVIWMSIIAIMIAACCRMYTEKYSVKH